MAFFQSVKVGGASYDLVPRAGVRGNPPARAHEDCVTVQLRRVSDPEVADDRRAGGPRPRGARTGRSARGNPPEFVMGDVVDTPRGRGVVTGSEGGIPYAYFLTGKVHNFVPARATQVAHVEGASPNELIRKFRELMERSGPTGPSSAPPDRLMGTLVTIGANFRTLLVRREEFERWLKSHGFEMTDEFMDEDWTDIMLHVEDPGWVTLGYPDGNVSPDRSLFRRIKNWTRDFDVRLREDVAVAVALHEGRHDRSRRGAYDNPRKKPVRGNPHLILLTGNPPIAPAEVEKRWCKFHQKSEFTGRRLDIGRIPGAPPMVFAVGELVDISFETAHGTEIVELKAARPWLVCNPEDDTLWLVAQEPMDVSKVVGLPVSRLTYDPPEASGKDPAYYRHKLLKPFPTMSPIGNPKRARAVLLEGGVYKVRDWLYD